MLKTFCFVIFACVTLSACGGGGSSGGSGAGSGTPVAQNAWSIGPIGCNNGCTSTAPGGIQLQVQLPNPPSCTDPVTLSMSNSNVDLGIPPLSNAVLYGSMLCAFGSFNVTETFSSSSGNTMNWPAARAYTLSGSGANSQWSATSYTTSATGLTINTQTFSTAGYGSGTFDFAVTSQ